MVEQICPRCRAGNPLENAYCGRCGARLEGEEAPLVVSRSRSNLPSLLPERSLQQVGRAVAVSLVALAAEASLSWLRRRLAETEQSSRLTHSKSTALIGPVDSSAPRRTVISSQRVWHFWQRGQITGQIVEHSVWKIDEQI